MPSTRHGTSSNFDYNHAELGGLIGLRYVHANYRFVVDPRGNYHSQAIDADVHLDWNDILQILASAQSQAASCPICLSTPVAPRMARCGHIFCLPCLIRYMHSTDDTAPVPKKKAHWKKCPICWDSVYLSETRPVLWFVGQEGQAPREGEDVVLRLMMRQAGSTLALPRDGAESLPKPDEVPWYFAAEVNDYARVMKGSEDYMRANYDREIEDLKYQEKEDELMFGEETQWTRRAIASIEEANEKVIGMGNAPSSPPKPKEKKMKSRGSPIVGDLADVPEFYLVQHAAKSGQSHPSSVPRSQSPPALRSENGGKGSPALGQEHRPEIKTDESHSAVTGSQISSFRIKSVSKQAILGPVNQHNVGGQPYFFYQALLHYYLSPLDIRILKAAFGEFASFPATILPRVERVSTGHIVDDDLRKRAKYLAHLPHGCEVGFLECNWTDLVGREVLQSFAPEIDRRRKRNLEKEVREEKERLRAEKEEDDTRWAAARRRRPSLSRAIAPPSGPESIAEPPRSSSSSVDFVAASSSPPWRSNTRQGSAFASLASPSTSPAATRTVWGTSIITPVTPPLTALAYEPETSENDGWLQGWEPDLLPDQTLLAQLQATSLQDDHTAHGLHVAQGKKKKNKKIMLMTTNARRGA